MSSSGLVPVPSSKRVRIHMGYEQAARSCSSHRIRRGGFFPNNCAFRFMVCLGREIGANSAEHVVPTARFSRAIPVAWRHSGSSGEVPGQLPPPESGTKTLEKAIGDAPLIVPGSERDEQRAQCSTAAWCKTTTLAHGDHRHEPARTVHCESGKVNPAFIWRSWDFFPLISAGRRSKGARSSWTCFRHCLNV